MTTNRVRTKRGMRRHKPDRRRAVSRIMRDVMMPTLADQLYGESPLYRRLMGGRHG